MTIVKWSGLHETIVATNTVILDDCIDHLMAVNFHDQRPSPTSACSHARHVTVNRNFANVSLEHVSCISSRPVEENARKWALMLFNHLCVLILWTTIYIIMIINFNIPPKLTKCWRWPTMDQHPIQVAKLPPWASWLERRLHLTFTLPNTPSCNMLLKSFF